MADDLRRLVAATRELTMHVDMHTSAEQLYRDASAVAEARIPGPLGVAVAGVLAVTAEHRRMSGLRGILGADRTFLALALTVLELDFVPDGLDIPEEPPA